MTIDQPSASRLNAVGKPRSPSYDPNYKRRGGLTAIARLRKPYRFVDDDDQSTTKKRRKRRLRPAPLLDLCASLESGDES